MNRSKGVAMVAVTVGLLWVGQAHAALIYRQNFDAANGTPTVTPGGGTLAVGTGGLNGDAMFSASGGVFGGSLDASGPANATAATAVAGTSVPGGTPVDNLGTISKFTVVFWFKAQGLQTGDNGRSSRLFMLGDSAVTDINSPNTIGIMVRNDRSGVTNRRAIDAYINGLPATPFDGVGNPNGIPGTVSALNEWTFIALTYDGTSTNANNSADQLAATSGASQINGQLYRGTVTTSVTRSEAPFTNNAASPAVPTDPSAGAVNLGATGSVLTLANLPPVAGFSRGLDGWMDDVRVYNSILTASEVEQLRINSIINADCTGVPAVSVPNLIFAGGNTLTVKGVNSNAQSVKVYANGTTLMGTATGNPPNTPSSVVVTVSPSFAVGQHISARQVIQGLESCVTPQETTVTESGPVAPDGLPNLRLWLKADAGVNGNPGPAIQGDKVSQWQDSSSGARHASQSTPENQPTYVLSNGHYFVRFAGDPTNGTTAANWTGLIGTFADADLPLAGTATDETIFMVFNPAHRNFDDQSNYSTLFGEFPGNSQYAHAIEMYYDAIDPATITTAPFPDPPRPLFNDWVLLFDHSPPNFSTSHLLFATKPVAENALNIACIDKSGTAGQWTVSGPSGTTVTSGPVVVDSQNTGSAMADYRIGVRNFSGNPQSAFTGDIGEIVIYNRRLDQIEIDAVNQYLAFKYQTGCSDPFADTDHDGDVDQDDFGAWQVCFNGSSPQVPVGLVCTCLDRDPIAGVGPGDLAAFLNCVSGPAIPAVKSCDNP